LAVLGFGTVQHVPFPVRVQRRTLEPDGIAIASVLATGDGSGGNVLITIRADTNEFFYILKAWSSRVGGVSTPGQLVVFFSPQWINDINTGTSAFDIECLVNFEQHGVNFRLRAGDIADVLRSVEIVPLGRVQALTAATQDLLVFNYEANVNLQVYDSQVLFYVYRKEALTVPGFLDQLVRPGLIR